jgi:EAL domain-containing protein (putative c-di-GMP-specific phosphodiesterase class I)
LQILRDLRLALENSELALHYQPQFDLESGELIGCEALLRWFDKRSNQFISPGIFVPIAESSGLVVPMGEWVIKTAIRQNREWQKAGHKPIRVAVNVSAAQFKSQDITAFVANELRDAEMSPYHLELEVTESAFMEDVDKTIEILKKLNGMGVEIAIDDFGTGYSSLSYLRQFPIDRLKIDQSFIKNALTNQDDAVITKSVIALAKSLNLRVIAEGVETAEHEAFLRAEQCQEVQGYYYGRPCAAAEFAEKFFK